MSNSIIRIVVAAALTASGIAPDARAYRQSGTYTPQVEGSGENMSAVVPMGVLGVVQPRAVVTGSDENQSVQHQAPPPPAAPGYIARIEGSGENLSVVHDPVGG